METILAKEFFYNSFNLSFLTDEERETIYMGAELYAKGKCKEQRQNCSRVVSGWPTEILTESEIEERVLNAPEPEFDLPITHNTPSKT